MLNVIDETLDDLEQRRIGRREAVARIATLAAALAGGASVVKADDAKPSATFPSVFSRWPETARSSCGTG